jgi:hypothetical protein
MESFSQRFLDFPGVLVKTQPGGPIPEFLICMYGVRPENYISTKFQVLLQLQEPQ